MTNLVSIFLNVSLTVFALSPVIPGDWAEWRGPAGDGISAEKNFPARWSPAGDNLAWKAPYGGRSAPIVMGDRVYLQDSVRSPAGKLDLPSRLAQSALRTAPSRRDCHPRVTSAPGSSSPPKSHRQPVRAIQPNRQGSRD